MLHGRERWQDFVQLQCPFFSVFAKLSSNPKWTLYGKCNSSFKTLFPVLGRSTCCYSGIILPSFTSYWFFFDQVCCGWKFQLVDLGNAFVGKYSVWDYWFLYMGQQFPFVFFLSRGWDTNSQAWKINPKFNSR